MTELAKLTKARRHALEWLRDNGPASLFPVAVNYRLLRKMIADGLVEEGITTRGGFPLPMMTLSITEAGRRALSARSP